MQVITYDQTKCVSGGGGVEAAAYGIGATTSLAAAGLAGATIATGGIALAVYSAAFAITYFAMRLK